MLQNISRSMKAADEEVTRLTKELSEAKMVRTTAGEKATQCKGERDLLRNPNTGVFSYTTYALQQAVGSL
jgi:hypothetical protein